MPVFHFLIGPAARLGLERTDHGDDLRVLAYLVPGQFLGIARTVFPLVVFQNRPVYLRGKAGILEHLVTLYRVDEDELPFLFGEFLPLEVYCRGNQAHARLVHQRGSAQFDKPVRGQLEVAADNQRHNR